MQNFRNNVSFYNRESGCGCERPAQNQTPCQSQHQMQQRQMNQGQRQPQMNSMLENTGHKMCCSRPDPVGDMPLAMAYVPWQRWQNIFEADKGFHCGTIFQELRKPFEHAGGGCR